jgi:putative protein-disulfide isomerase
MKPVLIYCYDAYCGWCYGFSPVIRKISQVYADRLHVEVLSGGMILPETPQPIGVSAGYIQEAYKRVEDLTGVRFGQDFLWHIFHPQDSDWFPHSEKSAIALCIWKEYFPEQQVAIASDLQYALKYEGRDLCDDEAYRHLLDKYPVPAEEFYEKLHSAAYKEKAHYEFSLVKQLHVTGFPAVLIQANDTKFYLAARGYTDYDTLSARIDQILAEIEGTVVRNA